MGVAAHILLGIFHFSIAVERLEESGIGFIRLAGEFGIPVVSIFDLILIVFLHPLPENGTLYVRQQGDQGILPRLKFIAELVERSQILGVIVGHDHRILDILVEFVRRQKIIGILVVARVVDDGLIDLFPTLVSDRLEFQVDVGFHAGLDIELHAALRVIANDVAGAGLLFVDFYLIVAVGIDRDRNILPRGGNVVERQLAFGLQARDLAGKDGRLGAAADGGQQHKNCKE